MGPKIPEVAKAILKFAKKYSDFIFLIFRETFAMHFGYAHNGVYHGYEGVVLRDPSDLPEHCCSQESVRTRFSTDDSFQKEFAILDSQWNETIFWLSTLNETSDLYEHHSEVNLKGAVDCLHYVYNPHMLSFIWRKIANFARRRIVHMEFLNANAI
jgi:hypothetical protein